MPAQIAHILAAEEALLRSAPELAEAWGIAGVAPCGEGLRRDEGPGAWFRLGAQGPDVFYHNQRTMPSGLHYGGLSHRKNYGLLVEGALEAILARSLDPEAAESAWLLGFATHAAVDRAIHPFVVFFSGWQSPLEPASQRLRGCHPFLERLLDLVLIEERRGARIADFDLELLLPLGLLLDEEEKKDAQAAEGVAALLHAALTRAYPRAAAADFLLGRRIANAQRDAAYFFRYTNPARVNSGDRTILEHFDDRSPLRSVSLIHPDTLPEGLDPGNLARRPWSHPAGDGRESKKDFLELFDQGVDEASQALEYVLADLRAGKVRPGLAALIGNGGLSVTDADGIPVPPRLSRPLGLPEAMAAEFEKRLAQARALATR